MHVLGTWVNTAVDGFVVMGDGRRGVYGTCLSCGLKKNYLITRFFLIRNRSIRNRGYRAQNVKKLKGYIL